VADAAADFTEVRDVMLSRGGDLLAAYCCDPRSESSSKRWLLLSFVPESAKPVVKMISASSRGALRGQLGTNFFVGEFHATSGDELTLAEVQAYQHHEMSETKSDAERMLEKEVRGTWRGRRHHGPMLNLCVCVCACVCVRAAVGMWRESWSRGRCHEHGAVLMHRRPEQRARVIRWRRLELCRSGTQPRALHWRSQL
jgi:hypothetical protein